MTQRVMRKPNSSVPNRLRQTYPQRHWLEFAEYASLAASGVGALVVALSGQAFYGVAPLTLALSLNVANRYRFEQQARIYQNSENAEVKQSVNKLEKTAVTVIIKLRRQLSADIESLRQQMAALPRGDGFDSQSIEIEQQLLSLGHSVASLQEIVASAVLDVRQHVSEQLQELSIGSGTNLESIEQAIEQLQNATKHLAETTITQDDWEGINTRFLEIQKVIANLHSQQQALSRQSAPDLSAVQTQIDRLEREQQEVVKPHLKRLISVVKQLQQES
ncbi:MAG: apolipoprotein A1/A4/E family protein [Oscillatoriaceae cyanobacterium Prado104]|nr:apolipoprotein A1/A4/E family protein [Oscillatoriaceae cyanobacterium Prado104]